jgi:hypothetical protein
MSRHSRCVPAVVFGIVAITLMGGAPAAAQDSQQPRAQAVSANPFGLLLNFFNAEFERQVSHSATAGAGGSTFGDSGGRYVNADVFYRYYLSGHPLKGWALGVKAGATSVTDTGTFFGIGFDANHSWLLGRKENIYIGLGFGLKRLRHERFGHGPHADSDRSHHQRRLRVLKRAL